MPRPRKPFWDRVVKTRGCWIWTGAKFKTMGYGKSSLCYGSQQAHRSAWILAKGPIPKGLWVLHRCDVRLCVNPKHLFLGTRIDNDRDMRGKGRHRQVRGFDLPQTQLSAFEVRRIIQLSSESLTQKEIARGFKVGQPHISRILSGQRRDQCQLA